jgi:hypothetical protein
MYWVRNCKNHFSVFDGKAGGCYECNPGFVVSKDKRTCIDLKPYLNNKDTPQARKVLSCRIFKNERPRDCGPNETDLWTEIKGWSFGPNDNSYSVDESD